MLALIGNVPELVHGARIPNCEYEAKNEAQLDCCNIYPSAYGCKNYLQNFERFKRSQEGSREGSREGSQEGSREESQEGSQEELSSQEHSCYANSCLPRDDCEFCYREGSQEGSQEEFVSREPSLEEQSQEVERG